MTTAVLSPAASRAYPGTFSAEFLLVLACLRWPFTAERIAHVFDMAASVADWDKVVAISMRHRVTGLVARALQQAHVGLPAATAGILQGAANAQAKLALSLTLETARLDRLFRAEGLEPLFLKGSTVTMLAYGELSLRHAKDIDLLVPQSDVQAAMRVLRGAGYLPFFALEDVSPERLRTFLHHGKSLDWMHPASGNMLELHWRLTDLPLLRNALETDSRQPVQLMSVGTVATLDREHLFAFLCVHGAAHGWSRLKWLADVYALLQADARHGENDQQLDALYRSSLRLGAGRCAGQALLLCHDLLHLPLPHALLSELEADPKLRLLRASAVRLLMRGGETEEVYDLPFGTSSIYLSRFLLGSSVGAILHEMRTWAYPPEQLLSSRMPQQLLALYPVVRVGSWLKARLQHRGRSTPQAAA